MSHLSDRADIVVIGAGIRQSMGAMGLRNETRHVYDPTTGWPVKVEAKKIIEADGRARTDLTIIDAA